MKMRGFLVIFLLVVIVIFFLYVAKQGGESHLEDQVDAFAEVKEKTTRTNLTSLERAIDLYIAQQGSAPKDMKELTTFGRTIYVDTDSWGNKIKYERTSDLNYRLISAGKDKTFHTDDDIVIEN